MLGLCCGRFLSVEVKLTSALSEDQERWGELMARLGAIHGVVRSVDEALALVRPHLRSV